MNEPLSRRLDRAESFFWMLDRCSSMNFAVMAEGHGAIDFAALEAAVARAQRIHPALAVAIDAIDGRLTFVPQRARLPFFREAGDVAWRTALLTRVVKPFDLGEAPLVRAHWLDLPDGHWVFALAFHHAIADGRSGRRLITEIIDDARGGREQRWGGGSRPSLMSLLPESLGKREWKEPPIAADVPGFSRATGPPRPHVLATHLDVRALRARARAEGSSVHGAIGAAELIAIRERFAVGTSPTLSLTSAIDLRKHLTAPMDDATPGLYVTLLSSSSAVSGDFWLLARLITTDLRRQLARGSGHIFYGQVPAEGMVPPTPAGIDGFRAHIDRLPQACVLSNVGQVPALADANGVCVDNVSFTLCPMPHQPLFVAASTWGDRLTLNVVHDANRFPSELVQRIDGRIRELLVSS